MKILDATFVSLIPLVLLVACEKKDADAASPSATASAAAAPEPGPVKYTTGDPEIAGDYDGTKAVVKGKILVVPRNCPTLSCEEVGSSFTFDRGKIGKICPKAYVMTVEVEKDLTQGSKQPMVAIGNSNIANGSANGLVTNGAEKNEIEVLSAGDRLVAKIDLKGMESFQGVVSAKVCKPE